MSIDLNFRPASYADFDDPVALTLNGIKGQMRREMVRDMLSADGDKREACDAVLGPVEDDILGEHASEGFVEGMNRSCGPSWMGGEYLPDLVERETEIARIVLASVTMDVFSVRACLVEGGYRYSIMDEYGTEFVVRPKTSRAPLTLDGLVNLIDTADGHGLESHGRSLVDVWWWQQWEHGYSPEECTDFAWVESEQYPELAAYYEERARQWRIARTRGRIQRCESEIQRVIENWRTANPFGPGMGGAMGHAAYKVRISTLEGFLRDTVAREGAMPCGLHTLEYQFCGPEVRTFSVNFDRLPKEARAFRVEKKNR